jgi:uncharacterized protein (TIRG00374 family)
LKTAARRYLEFIALCLLAIAIIWWFGRRLNWIEVREAVSKANWMLLAAGSIAIIVAYIARAFRWGAFLTPLGPSRFKDLFIATMVGYCAVLLVGRFGEVVRPVVLPMRDERVRVSSSFITILVERIYDMLAVAFLFAVNLLWLRPPASLAAEFSRVRFVGAALLAGSIGGVLFLAWFRKRSTGFIDFISKRLTFLPSRVAAPVLGLLEQLAKALRVLVDGRELMLTIGWTAVVWICINLGHLLVFRAFDLPFGISETVFVMGWSLVGSLVPTPGGAAGAFHAATAAGLIFLGVARDTAAAIAIILHLIDFSPALVFGLVYVFRGDVNLSRLRALTTSEAFEHAAEDNALDKVPKELRAGIAGDAA